MTVIINCGEIFSLELEPRTLKRWMLKLEIKKHIKK
jgi:hypothetical protein